MPPAGAPPGYSMQAAGNAALAKRFGTLGTTCLVLGILDILFVVQKLVSAALTSQMLALQGKMMPATTPGMPAVMSAAQDFATKIALWEALRALPFGVASGFLVWIGLRLRRGDRDALFTARVWTWWAFGVVAASALLQVVVTIPATLEYEQRIMSALPLPSKSGAPFDMKKFMDGWMLASTIIGLVIGTVFMAAWPLALRLWSDRLLRDTAPVEPPPA